jgi:ribosome assembly protein YihI (activator of Der GTPase)
MSHTLKQRRRVKRRNEVHVPTRATKRKLKRAGFFVGIPTSAPEVPLVASAPPEQPKVVARQQPRRGSKLPASITTPVSRRRKVSSPPLQAAE